MARHIGYVVREIPWIDLEPDEVTPDAQAPAPPAPTPPRSPTPPAALASPAPSLSQSAAPTARAAPDRAPGSPAHSDSSTRSPVRYPYVSDDDSYTLRYGRPAPTPTRPSPPATRPPRGRAGARISAGRRPTHQLAPRDPPRGTYEHGGPSQPANHGPRPSLAPTTRVQTPSPYYHPAPPPPQPIMHPQVQERLELLRGGYRSLTDRVCELDLNYICWRDTLESRTRDTDGTVREHRADTLGRLARVDRMIYAIGGIAVVAVLMSILPYFLSRYW